MHINKLHKEIVDYSPKNMITKATDGFIVSSLASEKGR